MGIISNSVSSVLNVYEMTDCVVCGSPLLFDRVLFRCFCGVLVHSYCWEKHVLQSHKPIFEMGAIDLNGEFRIIESKVPEEIQDKQVTTLEEGEIQEV